MKTCAEPRCPELVPKGETYCPHHWKAKRRASDRKRPSVSARGYGAEWRKTRKAFLQIHPICQDEAGCLEPATDVDHIDGLGPLGPRGFDFQNLRAFCHSHHSQRTARDQPGGWHAAQMKP